ncbi:hypothetical protein EMCRGX_G016317 [Ephydatia muelleri]
MYYFIPLCVAVLLHGTAALDGCNDTCSSILAVNGSGEFDVDCNSGVTGEYFKCISASTGCDDIAKSRIAEHSILQYYPAAWSKESKMFYFIPLCVAVLLHGTAALDGCNDTCSSILAVNGSGEFDVDCNSGVTAEYFKCISASTGCDDIAKSRIAEHNIIPQHGQERGGAV